MTIEQFNDLIENHDDIMMHCESFKFTIMTCYEKLLIGEQNKGKPTYYDTVEDMLDGFKVNGKPLGEVIEAVVLDSCA